MRILGCPQATGMTLVSTVAGRRTAVWNFFLQAGMKPQVKTELDWAEWTEAMQVAVEGADAAWQSQAR